jgi:hypothetical protein
MTGHIYFLRHGEFVKIGFSTDYQSRCASIAANSPEATEIIAAHPGTYADEARFHRLLKSHHHRLEWYRWTPEVEALAISGLPPEVKRIRAGGSRLDAVRKIISGAELAKAIKATPQAVSQWKRVPIYRVLQVERLTGVPRSDLRPDIYPPSENVA